MTFKSLTHRDKKPMPLVAPYGTWQSDISADALASEDVKLMEVATGSDRSGKVYFIEARPAENGRCCIVRNGQDILPKGFSAQTSVHGYGGGAMAVRSDGKLIFTDWDTKGIYLLDPALKEAACIIDGDREVFYANFNIHETLTNWVLAVCEDHRSTTVVNSIVAIDLDTKSVHTVVSGADFYSHPQFDVDTPPDRAARVCWMQWNHPDMPWTGSELFVAPWRKGHAGALGSLYIGKASRVAGSPGTESIAQPRWGPDGSLFFCSDRTGFWQLYRLEKGSTKAEHVFIEGLEDGEFAGPEWFLGSSSYTFLTRETLVALWTHDAVQRVIFIDLPSSTYDIPPYPSFDSVCPSIQRRTDTSVVLIGSTPSSPTALLSLDRNDTGHMSVIKSSSQLSIHDHYLSHAQSISFPSDYGPGGAGTSHALFFQPRNPDFKAPENSLPPLIVWMHDGPTRHVGPSLSPIFLYWTTRGFAVAALNYAGSSGYGRAYRQRLDGQWGIAEATDAASCVEHLASQKLIDRTRVGIVGGSAADSAGGYACLQALCSYPDIWAGGVCLYGVGDAKALVQDTHKFESRYTDRLLFDAEKPESDEEKETILRNRSPHSHAQKIKAPILLLQGRGDQISSPNQAEKLAEIVKENGGKAKVLFFENEGGHGASWKAQNVKNSILEQERWWKETLVRGK